MLTIDILTIFPDFYDSPLKTGIIRRAIERGIIYVNVIDIRRFVATRHDKIDDYPFGGGAGMVMKPEPLFRAIRYIERGRGGRPKIFLLTPQGKKFSQNDAVKLSKLKRFVLICGRYEGIDERVAERLVDEELSIGDYVLSGGEIASLVVTEATTRLIPGVVGNKESVSSDTFSGKFLKYPQYTRPRSYLGMEVPKVLLSGNHKEIEKWRLMESIKRTISKRPDSINRDNLTDEEKGIIKGWGGKGM